MIYKATILKGY